jgi:predicted dehydrogenase
MKQPFRIAFIGIDHPHGAGWRKALLNLGDEVQISAVVPRFNGATASLEERNAGAARFETVEELIDWGQFDGAIVCLPNNESPRAITTLAQAGKHLLAEKPAAATAADAEPMVQAILAAGVAFQSGYMWRYDPLAQRLREMVADQRFGKLISIEMSFVTSNVARRGREHYLFDRSTSGGGFFNWLACHWLDLLFYVTQQPVVGVTARIGNFGATPTEVEDGGVAILDLAEGGIATFVGGYWLPRWTGESFWRLRGRDRWVHWDPGRAGTGGALDIFGPQPQFDAMNETFTAPEDKTPGYGGRRAVELLQDWLAATRQPNHPCRNTPQSLLTTLKLLDAVTQSSEAARRLACQIGP